MIDTDSLRARIADITDDLVAIRRDLHAHPELGYEETRTSGVVRRELEAAGVPFVADLAGGTGVLGHLDGDAEQAVGLRADMDALPITEQTGADHASTVEGKMHACGHDGHTTILIGAARVLAGIARDQGLPRPIAFCFQPAEEGGGGGAKMVEDGVLDGRAGAAPVSRIFALHGWPELPLGALASRSGPLLAATDLFDIHVRGTQTHAAFPHHGQDVVLCQAAIVTALQQIAARNVDPLDSLVVSATKVHAGTAYNVLPSEATISGTIRSLLPGTRELARQRVAEISEHVARAHGCEAEVVLTPGYPATVNDDEATERFRRAGREAVGDGLLEMPNPVMGGEDFAYYGQVVPACFFTLGLGAGEEPMPNLHHPRFDFNDAAIPLGVEMMCRLALQPE